MIKKAQMMLQASIGRTAENAEIEQLEATIESAKNLGLPSEGLFILTVQILLALACCSWSTHVLYYTLSIAYYAYLRSLG